MTFKPEITNLYFWPSKTLSSEPATALGSSALSESESTKIVSSSESESESESKTIGMSLIDPSYRIHAVMIRIHLQRKKKHL